VFAAEGPDEGPGILEGLGSASVGDLRGLFSLRRLSKRVKTLFWKLPPQPRLLRGRSMTGELEGS
jgi:hypothetical protein